MTPRCDRAFLFGLFVLSASFRRIILGK
jgi:hypothetical protein